MKIKQLERRERTARIPHICDCCGATIHPGQRYVKVTHTENGALLTWKYHKGPKDCRWRKTLATHGTQAIQ